MTAKVKRSLAVLGALLGLLALTHAALSLTRAHARRAWKEAALAEIRALAEDPDWVSREAALVSDTNSTDSRIIAAGWLSDRTLLMQSGAWVIYRSHCGKVPPRLVRNIFLAKGSNGRWYYSTCHFCVGMCVLVMTQDGPPTDLATFADRYHLREFDGVSDPPHGVVFP